MIASERRGIGWLSLRDCTPGILIKRDQGCLETKLREGGYSDLAEGVLFVTKIYADAVDQQ